MKSWDVLRECMTAEIDEMLNLESFVKASERLVYHWLHVEIKTENMEEMKRMKQLGGRILRLITVQCEEWREMDVLKTYLKSGKDSHFTKCSGP